MRTIIGLDIGGTKTAVVEGAYDGEILQRIAYPTEAERPFEETFPRLESTMRQVIATAATAERFVAAISVSIGGPLRISDGHLIDPPHLPGWHNLALKEKLEKTFPAYPVCVEHDGNAGALAEYHFGIGKDRDDLKHLVFLTFGTGLGAGFIVNGSVLHGASDTAGEVGHWRLSREGPVGFGKAGSWEGLASGAGLVQMAHAHNATRWPPNTPIRSIVEAMLNDDPEALYVATRVGYWMGQGMALLIDALNPQVIALGSLGVVLGERILAPARDAIRQEALPQAVAACEIVPAVLGTGIGDVASLMAGITHERL